MHATPESWKDSIKSEQIAVLPIAKPNVHISMPGWCTGGSLLEGAPEVEVFCTGINSKLPSHAGLWREGQFLHFGFEPSPAELNDAGQSMLVNSIVYISRFGNDRAIGNYQSPFLRGGSSTPRSSVEHFILVEKPEKFLVDAFLDPALAEKIMSLSLEKRREWFAAERAFLHPGGGPERTLTIDEDVKVFGIGFDSREFITKAIVALESADGPTKLRAARLLDRYVDDGPHPTQKSNKDAWTKWYEENAPALFFSEVCGYKWLVDPLAKERKISTAELRGSKRADR
ncbi:MAG: hypothetical protein HY286_11835 [Planctomycetes bacterium]|nr:hypothetical protein [Planctomycetota bacterium]